MGPFSARVGTEVSTPRKSGVSVTIGIIGEILTAMNGLYARTANGEFP